MVIDQSSIRDGSPKDPLGCVPTCVGQAAQPQDRFLVDLRSAYVIQMTSIRLKTPALRHSPAPQVSRCMQALFHLITSGIAMLPYMASGSFLECIHPPDNIMVLGQRVKLERSFPEHAKPFLGMRLDSLGMLATQSHQCVTDIITLASQMQPGCHVWYCHLLSSLGLMMAASDLLNLQTYQKWIMAGPQIPQVETRPRLGERNYIQCSMEMPPGDAGHFCRFGVPPHFRDEVHHFAL